MLCSVAFFNPTVDLCDLLQLLVCHGVSVEKSTERRQGSDCLLMEGVGMNACPPPRLSGADHASEAGLGCGLCLASDPHGLPGFEVAAL